MAELADDNLSARDVAAAAAVVAAAVVDGAAMAMVRLLLVALVVMTVAGLTDSVGLQPLAINRIFYGDVVHWMAPVHLKLDREYCCFEQMNSKISDFYFECYELRVCHTYKQDQDMAFLDLHEFYSLDWCWVQECRLHPTLQSWLPTLDFE